MYSIETKNHSSKTLDFEETNVSSLGLVLLGNDCVIIIAAIIARISIGVEIKIAFFRPKFFSTYVNN